MSFHDATVPAFLQILGSLNGILTKAEAYCATKGAVAGFTKAVAMECCEFGEPVRVNSVHPGPVATNIFASALPHSDPAMVAAMGGLAVGRDPGLVQERGVHLEVARVVLELRAVSLGLAIEERIDIGALDVKLSADGVPACSTPRETDGITSIHRSAKTVRAWAAVAPCAPSPGASTSQEPVEHAPVAVNDTARPELAVADTVKKSPYALSGSALKLMV